MSTDPVLPEQMTADPAAEGEESLPRVPDRQLAARSWSTRALVLWMLIMLLMSSVLFRILMDHNRQNFNLNLTTFLVGAGGVAGYPPGYEYARVWSSRIGATVPARAWLQLFFNAAGRIEVDTAVLAMSLYSSILFFLSLLVLFIGTGDTLAVTLLFFGTVWIEIWQDAGAHYPWDFSCVLLFSLCVVLVQRQRLAPVLFLASLGVSIKLTAATWLACAGFHRAWPWRKRLIMLAVGGLTCLLVKLGCDLVAGNQLLLTPQAHSHTGGYRLPLHLLELMRLSVVNPVFIGGGLLLAFVLCVRRGQLGYLVLVAAFVAGQFLFASPQEFRVYLELMPICAVVVAGAIRGRVSTSGSQEPA